MRRRLPFVPFVAGLLVGCTPADPIQPPAAGSDTTSPVIDSGGQPPKPPKTVEPYKIGLPGGGGGGQAGGKWVTVKGQVVLSEAAFKAMPAKQPINVSANPEHCLSKGPLFPEDTIVNPKTRGIQNVVVWLRPANKERDSKLPADAIYPELVKDKVKPKEHVIDQPCCQFVPRITVAREGDTIEFKNSSPINHNTKWSSNENGEFNVNIAPGQTAKVPNPLKYERTQIPFECNVHPWMKGQVRVFDHPYFALTDADGKFEIKNAPAGTYHIVYAHENGYHKGADGRFGWPIEIKDAGNGTMELKPLEYEFPKN
jgi:plastocyanin